MISRIFPFAFLAGAAFGAEARIPVEFAGPGEGPAPRPGAAEAVDFRFAPPRWQTSICLPDDPSKTLVDSEGRLLYEYGGGPHDGFGTRIGALLGDGPPRGPFRQTLADPRVPIVKTRCGSGGLALEVEAFAAAPSPSGAASEPPPRLERLDGAEGQRGWAAPAVPCDPVFKDAAIGWGRSIEYRFRAEPGRTFQAALGFCEGHHPDPGKRVEEIRIEGKAVKTIDPVRDAGRNVPLVVVVPARDADGDGWIQIAVAAAETATDKNTILNGLWVFEGDAPRPEEVLSGKLPRPPAAFAAGGPDEERVGPGGRARADLFIVRAVNGGGAAASAPLALTVESTRKLEVSEGRGLIRKDGRPFLALDPAPRSSRSEAGKLVLEYGSLEVPAGGTREIAATVLLGSKASGWSPGEAEAERARAEAYWRGLPLPWDRIAVPDAGVQALLDSSVRNIYQARETKRGLPAFQVGPTCYRGLWVVDGSFLLEAASYLGRLDEARAGIDYLLTFRRPDGAIQIMDGHLKETGIAIWILWRHAQLTGDRGWLAKVWPAIEGAVAHIRALRERSRKDPAAPEADLIPRGFSDGGLGGIIPEYTNVYWNLVGMRSAVQAARWLGKDEARGWDDEYRDFFAAYRRAAERDRKSDEHGNRYVPIVMTGGPAASPQRAQWAFLHGIFPGKLFERDDPLAAGTLAMLTATEKEGLIFGTGWIPDGIWNYAGSFYGHANLWMGRGRKAGEILYSFANHASPLLAWREEQALQGGTNVVGDMPHNWASAEFIRLVRHLVLLERGDELHLLEGLPPAWVRAGGDLRLREIATEFGPASLEMSFGAGGRTARLRLVPPSRRPPSKLVVHLETWAGGAASARAGARKLDLARPELAAAPGEPLELEIAAGE